MADGRGGVQQMRLVVEAADFEAALNFYRDVLGGREELRMTNEGAELAVLDMGRATLELSNPQQVADIDEMEVGRRVSPHVRVAFEVVDAEATTRDLVGHGAELIAPPTQTPWRSLNARLSGLAGLQLTVFEQLEPE